MSFDWPLALISLVVVPALLLAYWLLLRRRRKQAVRYSSVALLRTVLPKRKRWLRHLPVALLLGGLAALAVAAARPHVVRDVPYKRTSVILALDVSGSMCSNDVDPNRLAVAQDATRTFVKRQPNGVRMGLVVFSGFPELVVPPTSDREALLKAVDGLTVGRGTAIGGALLKAVDAIAEVNPDVRRIGDVPETATPPQATPPGPRGYVPDIIVLLTDGRNTRGIEPLAAVPYVVQRRVRVYPVGFGTTNPADLACTREQLGGDAFDRFGGGGGRFGGGGFGFRQAAIADEPTLKAIASRTGGTFHAAKGASQLQKVFSDLPSEVATQRKRSEVTWLVAALGALLATAALAASLRWSPYP
jgi:Ca-activated chloride channel homolog